MCQAVYGVDYIDDDDAYDCDKSDLRDNVSWPSGPKDRLLVAALQWFAPSLWPQIRQRPTCYQHRVCGEQCSNNVLLGCQVAVILCSQIVPLTKPPCGLQCSVRRQSKAVLHTRFSFLGRSMVGDVAVLYQHGPWACKNTQKQIQIQMFKSEYIQMYTYTIVAQSMVGTSSMGGGHEKRVFVILWNRVKVSFYQSQACCL